MILTVTGNSFTSYSSIGFGSNGSVDWGDESSVESLTGNQTISHTYSDGLSSHTVVLTDVTSLGLNCFRECTGLTGVVIPDSVTSLGNACFYSCTGLTRVVIPNNVTTLKADCFMNSGLTSVSIPDSVTSLGDRCFNGCSSLTSVVIPDSVTSLGEDCFRYCSSLTKIILKWASSTDIPTYDSTWIELCPNNLKFVIPVGTTSLYTAKNYPTGKLQELKLPQSLSINNKTVKSLTIQNKKIRSITKVSDGELIYHTPEWVEAESNPIQSGDTTDIYANTPLGDSGYPVYFFEQITPVFRLTAEPSIIEVGEPTDIYATVKDSDGSKIGAGTKVHFYTDTILSEMLFVSADKPILSYADNEKAVITAKLYGADVSGQTVTFKQGNTVLATETTDSNGEASYEYTSQGAGDVTLTVECMSLQETYSLEDCWNAQIPEYSKSTSSTDVYSIGMDTVHNIQNDDFILEFDFKSNGYGGILCLGASNQWSASNDTADYRLFMGNNDNSSRSLYYGYRTTSTNNNNGNNRTADQYYNMKIVREGTSVKYYIDNTLINTLSVSFLSDYSSWSIYGVGWSNATIYFKNIRLKPL